MAKKAKKFVTYVVAAPALHLGGSRISLKRGNTVEIDREASIIRYRDMEYNVPGDVAIIFRNREESENPWIVDDTAENRKSFKLEVIKPNKVTIPKMEVIESDADIGVVTEMPKSSKPDLNRPKKPIDRNRPMTVEPQSIVKELPIKKVKSL